jgi:hypothetical protein
VLHIRLLVRGLLSTCIHLFSNPFPETSSLQNSIDYTALVAPVSELNKLNYGLTFQTYYDLRVIVTLI